MALQPIATQVILIGLNASRHCLMVIADVFVLKGTISAAVTATFISFKTLAVISVATDW